jgi:hypothetical protein
MAHVMGVIVLTLQGDRALRSSRSGHAASPLPSCEAQVFERSPEGKGL